MKSSLLKILQWILRFLARLTIWRYEPGIIGITGSVGKTSTKIAIQTVLGYDRRVRASSKSFNNELGLPLAILGDWQNTEGGFLFWLRVILASLFQLIIKLPNYPEILVLEYGIDKPNDMKYLLDITRPQLGVITAIGDIPVHVEFFSGPEAIAREKSKLINQLPATGFAILNADDMTVLNLKSQTRAHVITFGFSDMADMRISNFESHFDGKATSITFKLTYGGSFVPVRLEGLLGKTQAYSAAVAAAIGLIFGMNLVKIAEALNIYQSPPGRLKGLRGIKQSFIIDDTYNASPLSTHAALDTLRDLKAKRKIAVLGDMLEIGRYTMEAHESIGRLAAKSADLLFVIGSRAKFITEAAGRSGLSRKSIFSFDNLEEAIELLQKKIQKGDLILIKGSQAVRLEKIVKTIIADTARVEELLVRQSKYWLDKPGLYDGPIV